MTNLKNLEQEKLIMLLHKIRGEESMYEMLLNTLDEEKEIEEYNKFSILLKEANMRKKELVNYIDSQSTENLIIDWFDF